MDRAQAVSWTVSTARRSSWQGKRDFTVRRRYPLNCGHLAPAGGTLPHLVRHTDQLAAAGFNALFLETFYTGYTIYPSAIAPQRGEFVGWDPLQVWAEEAAARGIELHLWVHLFHLGRITVDMHPDWANLQRDGSIGAALEPGLYYGDPGHPEVRSTCSRCCGMVERYPVTACI